MDRPPVVERALDVLASTPGRKRSHDLELVCVDLCNEIERMRLELNTPHIADFLEAVRIEALHQRERWGVDHDAGKTAADWFWLIGYLTGKALHAAVEGNREKSLHHTISSAAVLLNWHAHISGASTAMRPGLAEDDPRKAGADG